MGSDYTFMREVAFVRSRRASDRSVSMTLETKTEQTNEQFAEIDRFTQSNGILIFRRANELTSRESAELEQLAATTEYAHEGKSFSERLRSVIFRRWEISKNPDKGSADQYYAKRMNEIIKEEKEFLPPIETHRGRLG